MILDDIIAHKKKELTATKKTRSLSHLESLVKQSSAPRSFASALTAGNRGDVRIIAEVKKASPSRGVIRQEFNPVTIARDYERGGAVAVSVLTEKRFFQGDLSYLEEIKKKISLPVLRKDFILDPYQIYESRVFGADAVLLIVAALDPILLRELLELARTLSLDALVEVHTRDELAVALDVGATVIGINNRDLRTFRIDVATTVNLCREVPDGKIVVSESGIDSRDTLRRLLDAGVDAFLIGEALMRAPSPGEKLRELIG